MKEEIREILEFQVPIQVYESVDEADKAAGVAGATLRKALDLLLFHGTYADGRELITECIQEVTKVPFLTTTTKEKNDKGVEVEVTERDWDKDGDAKYAKRALALKPESKAAVQALVTQRARGYKSKDEKGVEIVIPALAVNIKARARTGPKTKTLAKKFQDVALAFLLGKPVVAGAPPASLKKFNLVLEKAGLGTFTPVDGVPISDPQNVMALGWLCKAWSDAQDVFKAVS